MTTITNHGVQVSTSRQWTYALTPDAAGTDWNYIQASWYGAVGEPIVYNIVKKLTTTPTFSHTNTTTHNYPNSNFGIFNQLRAANGRIFFPCFGNNVVYYDPTAEDVFELATIVESPPVNPNASTILFSASFDVAGQLYFGTQESEFRPAMIVQVDPTTLVQTILGYVGTSAAYTTYAYRLAPDTTTATKHIYVAFGQNPWQLWDLNITSGVATKLYEVPSTGNIFFEDIPNKGWIATIDTNLGQPGNVRTQWWCLDGALYAYTVGVGPPVTARNVTPASAPLTTPPQIDATAGTGIVRWRPNGSSGAYTTVNYPVFNAAPVQIESLVDWSGGVVGNAAGYQGFFRFTQPSTSLWFGYAPLISKGPRLTVDDEVYAAGYPNGVMVRYDPASAWDLVGASNPVTIGNYGLYGTLYAGIKYSDFMCWASGVGAQGTMYVAGSRERNGDGSGIGGWDKASNTFFGTYTETGMDLGTPQGMCVLSSINRVAMTQSSFFVPAAPSDALLLVFDNSLSLVYSDTPIPGESDLGQIYDSSTSGVLVGIRQGAGNSLNLWSYDAVAQTLLSNTDLGLTGGLQPTQYRPPGTNKVYVTLGTNIVRVDLDALTADVVADVSSITGQVDPIALAGDGVTMFAAGGLVDGVSNAELYSFRIDDSITVGTLVKQVTFSPVILSNGGSVTLAVAPFHISPSFSFVDYTVGSGVHSATDSSGNKQLLMRNNEGSTVMFGQPVYASDDLAFNLARADHLSTSKVIGLTGSSIGASSVGSVVLDDTIEGTTAQWDAVCGTTGGLTFNTVYYLSAATPGRLTATPPTTGHIVPVIIALSNNKAQLVIKPPIKL